MKEAQNSNSKKPLLPKVNGFETQIKVINAWIPEVLMKNWETMEGIIPSRKSTKLA